MTGGPLAIVGGGAWGTALAVHFGRRGAEVRLWLREADLVARMRARGDNPVYLPGVRVPPTVRPTGDLGAAVVGAGLVLFVVPTPFARATHEMLAGRLEPGVPVVVGSKGIEESTLALPLDVAGETLGEGRPLAVLSGPTFAAELAADRTTAVAIGSPDADLARALQTRLSTDALRLYTNDDVVGLQVAGALKNVIAIAVGVAEGLGLGTNARAALVTRGLAEIARLGCALGGRAATFSGLAGLGDLVLTCTGDLSRNRRVGVRLGRGERLAEIVASTPAIAEGVRSAASARELGRRHAVELPIVEQVDRILHEEGTPEEALARLMARPLRAEGEEARTR